MNAATKHDIRGVGLAGEVVAGGLKLGVYWGMGAVATTAAALVPGVRRRSEALKNNPGQYAETRAVGQAALQQEIEPPAEGRVNPVPKPEEGVQEAKKNRELVPA